MLSAEPEIALVRDHAGRIALHYVCTYNGSKHQGRQLYAGAPVEATRIVRAHVARCTTSRAASPSRDVPEHSIAKSVRVRVCVVRCVFLRARTTCVSLCGVAPSSCLSAANGHLGQPQCTQWLLSAFHYIP